VPKEQKRVSEFKAKNKDVPLGQVTVDMVTKIHLLFRIKIFVLDLWWYAWYQRSCL
jgi:hypothetical protein